MSRLVRVLLVPLLLAPACTDDGGGPSTAATGAPTPSPSPSIVINPPGVVVINHALGPSKKRVRRAMRDLKAVNLWRPLTKPLYKVKWQSRLGRIKIPEDGHLADALLTAAFDKRAQGRLCDVMFFPNAISRDLDRWRYYYGIGATSNPPPTLRQLWAAVMAHELAHCLPGNPGEKVAEKWEAKALVRLRKLSD